MSFAAPLFLALAGLALPIAILYILKVKRRRVTVPYLKIWESLLVETKARSLFKRLKRLFSLLLQLLILALLTMALAQPAFELSSVKKESIVVLLDVSASMQALEGDPEAPREELETRHVRMLRKAREIVEGRSYEDEMMIAAISDRVDVLAAFNRNTLRLREALEGVEPTHRSLDVDAAVSFAEEITADRENPVLIWITDRQGGAIERALPADLVADVMDVGGATENVGITRFSVRKNTSLGTDYVLLEVQNFGRADAELELALTIDGRVDRVLPREIAAGGKLDEEFQLSIPEGATLHIETGHEDALPLDDEAWAVARPLRKRKIVLVTEREAEAIPFWIAFRSMSEVVDPASFSVSSAEYPTLDADARRADVTVCVGVIPDGLPPTGNLVLLNTDVPGFLPLRQTGIEANPAVWDWDRDHLLNRYLNFRDLPLPAARVVALDAGTALVESYEGPLLSAFELPGRMAVYVGFDMTARMFPFRLAFPVLLRNAMAWFEVEEDVVLEALYAPGETIQPLRRVRATRANVTWLEAGVARSEDLTLDDGRFYFSGTDRPGVYVFRLDGNSHPTCVNLFDANESSICPPEDEEGSGKDAASVETGRHILNRELWTILAALGLLAWALEWAFYHRRITE